jgi:hypothetical protein
MMIRKIRIICAIVLILLIPAEILLSGAQIVGFHARRQAKTVVIEWITESEDQVDKYILERSTDKQHWTQLSEIRSKLGTSTTRQSYNYVDQSIFKSNNLSTFYYRIIVVDQNGHQMVHAVIASISGQSGIKHTWGSIKALFR